MWDKLLKSRRGCLETVRPRGNLKPRDFLKANPRVCLYLGQIVEKPQELSQKEFTRGESEAEGFSEGKPEGAARVPFPVSHFPIHAYCFPFPR